LATKRSPRSKTNSKASALEKGKRSAPGTRGRESEEQIENDDGTVVIEASGEVIEEEVVDEDADEDDFDEEGADDEIDEADFAEEFDENADEASDDDISTALVVRGKSDSLAKNDPLQAYMREVQAHSLLTPEEEKALAVRYAETQDVDAAARLVTANLRLVVKLAYEYRRAYRNMMDLIQEGNMGLMQAVKKYDPYRGVKLSSYAAWWIRAYMLRYILSNWRMVKLGTTQAQRKLFFNLNKEKAKLSAMGIEPTHGEIARRLEVTEKEVEEMDKRMARSDASLDTPVNESDGRQISRVELLPGEALAPDLATESAELGSLLREHLSEFRKGLTGKDLIIFDERLIADEPRTLQDLGDQFGVSRERVRQLEARMTGKLRDYLSERIGDPVTFGA
jgi:RNA polymerase sigma-32 factor